MRKQLEEEIRKENTKHTEAESLKEEFERLKQINVDHYAQAAAFQHTFEKFERLKSTKTMLESNRKHILDGMTEMSGESPLTACFELADCHAESTDELGHMLKNFDSHLKSIEAKKAKQVELREKEASAVEDLRRRERNLASTQGGLVANRKVDWQIVSGYEAEISSQSYERNVREREAAVREASKQHNFSGYDYSPLEEAKIVEFVDKLHEMVRKAESDLRKLQVSTKRSRLKGKCV